MEFLPFIVIAAIWAVFLLPSFFESRRRAPIHATRDFARSTALLASVATVPGTEVMARRKARERRRRLLYALASAAVVSLGIAVVRSSLVWLGIALVFDLAIAGYVALLVQLRQQGAPTRVFSIARQDTALEEPEHHTVRVVAG